MVRFLVRSTCKYYNMGYLFMAGATMKAGRELDSLIAEKITGWERKIDNPLVPTAYAMPCYSTNDSDTIKMLETFGSYWIAKNDGRYRVTVHEDTFYSVTASTLGEAACNVALKAVGYEESKE